MLKWLLVLAVIAGVYYFFIKKKPLKTSVKSTEKEPSSDMVACVVCGTYCSLADALIKERQYYCSKECMEAV